VDAELDVIQRGGVAFGSSGQVLRAVDDGLDGEIMHEYFHEREEELGKVVGERLRVRKEFSAGVP